VTTVVRRLAALDALLADLHIRGEHDEARKVAEIRRRISRGVPPRKGAPAARYRVNVKPVRARELRTLEPLA
jgi:hypothetical protein